MIGAAVELKTTVLSDDATSVVQTFTQTVTKTQLLTTLAQLQQKASELSLGQARVNEQIASLQVQLALFQVKPVDPAPVADAPAVTPEV